ncbi:beta-lactamase/transpeptidase-like protein [Parathielavia appendiculata]|uniref:Beta-lactamase/transpeptidase-like protein n=1 Tax=Parathielavia appendiculata TaxID=2587402 RepID=A0AAN6TTF7_9PEZI|nr:beta-lactamase/transpeptidase-like protein [Parathielavia appendiculata]
MVQLIPLLLVIPATLASSSSVECRPEGPIFPRPRHLNQSGTFKGALDKLTATLDAAFHGRIRTGWDLQNISLSMAVVGLDQTQPSIPLWEYHRLAPGNVNGTKSLDRHSQYLIGSVSKVLTDALLMKSGVDMDDAVTEYLPSLDNGTSLIDWSQISLRALGGHLAGIPPNYGFSEYHYLKTWFEALGFPHVKDTDYPPCGVIGLNGECTKAQLLEGMLSSHPVAPPQSRPVYSNVAYTLLSYALEVHTGKNYSTLLRDLLTRPLNMSSTVPSGQGNDSHAVIPPVQSTWGSSYGDNVPGGGLVSTLADLGSFVHAILGRDSRRLGLTATQVREWLQPRSFAGSRSSFVGLPWEIFRPEPKLLFSHYHRRSRAGGGHTVTIHSKGGAAYGYNARIALLDEYGVGLVILTAGGQDVVTGVFDAALSVLVPALDEEAREQAAREYVGAFVAAVPMVVAPVNATTETDGTSLRLTGLYRNGTDILASLRELWEVTLFGFLPSLRLTGVVRLYPAEVERKSKLPDGREVVEEEWRLWWDMELLSEAELPGKGISAHDCLAWSLADWMHYGGEPVDRVVFVKDAATDSVVGFDAPFLRSGTMEKS